MKNPNMPNSSDQFSAMEQEKFTNIENIRNILAGNLPDKPRLIQFLQSKKITPEQIKVWAEIGRVRKQSINRAKQETEERKKNHPERTDEELRMGAYKEQIEDEVRDAVFVLRQMGYATFSSGFDGLDNQVILFKKQYEKLAQFSPSLELLQILREANAKAKFLPTEIRIYFQKAETISSQIIKKIWDKIVKEMKEEGFELREEAPAIELPSAVLFRTKAASRK